MAYCSNCGAYIPDGDTKCVACGTPVYTPPKNDQYGGFAASGSYNYAGEDLRDHYNEQREANRERNREWAEKARQEYQSAREYNPEKGARYINKAIDGLSGMTTSRILAVLSYFSVLCLIPFIFFKDDEYARFHGKQGILLLIMSIIIDVISGISGIAGAALSICRLYLIVKGIINAWNGRMERLPIIGEFTDKL